MTVKNSQKSSHTSEIREGPRFRALIEKWPWERLKLNWLAKSTTLLRKKNIRISKRLTRWPVVKMTLPEAIFR